MSSYNRNKIKKSIYKFTKKTINHYNKDSEIQKTIRKDIDRNVVNIRDSGVSEENIDRWFGKFKNKNTPKLICVSCENEDSIKFIVCNENTCVSECLYNVVEDIAKQIKSEFGWYIDDIVCCYTLELCIYIKLK